MRKALLRLFIFFSIIALADVGFRYLVGYLKNNAKGGTEQRAEYIANKMEADVIIMGSSRGRHHYDPKIIEDSTGMSYYNCSLDGNGIVLMYGRYKMLSSRYNPKLVIYDVYQPYDIEQSDNTRFLPYLRPFYDRPGIDSILWSVDEAERVKMVSYMYRYNSRLFELISDCLEPQETIDGYTPLEGTMQESKYTPPSTLRKLDKEADKLKLYYLERLIQACKGKSKLVFVASPYYGPNTYSSFKPLQKLCRKYDVPFYNFQDNGFYNKHPEWFYDTSHLNETGAKVWTKQIIHIIKQSTTND
jgi:hypothetical protein